MPIRFGTDGWRAVISDEFTFANVRLVAQAFADYILEGDPSTPSKAVAFPSVVVGFDTRFLSDRYAMEVAKVLAANGVKVYLARADCPTPALSYAVRDLGACAGVMITASHNPPRYNGIKFKASYGGPAMPEVTQSIEWRLAEGLRKSKEPPVIDWEEAEAHGIIERFDPMPAYLEHVRSLVDLPLIADSGLNVVIDPIYGAGRGYIKELLEKTGCNTFEIHGQMNPGFGGIHPEPIERNLQELIETVKGGPYDVGLAMDGDADRIGAVDARGCFVDPHRIFALALRHLVEGRGLRGEVVKTVSTTQMVELLAENYNLPLYETPVGFNHICKLMLEKDILIGGEESGGITVKGHIPEGDGILMGLLLLEIIASCGKPLHVIIDELMYDIGRFHYGRNDLEVKAFSKKELVNRLTSHPPFRIAGLRVKGMNCKDGVKYLLEDDSWLLIRPSGTEPVLRIYAEARSEEGVFELLAWGRELAEGF